RQESAFVTRVDGTVVGVRGAVAYLIAARQEILRGLAHDSFLPPVHGAGRVRCICRRAKVRRASSSAIERRLPQKPSNPVARAARPSLHASTMSNAAISSPSRRIRVAN